MFVAPSSLVKGFVVLSYASNWVVALQALYLAFSFFLALIPFPRLWSIQFTWVIFSIAINFGIVVVFFFWWTEFLPDMEINYYTIVSHGVTFALCFLDGFCMNRTPVRLKHVIAVQFWAIVYILWTIIFMVAEWEVEEVDIPLQTDETSPPSLYEHLNWNEDPAQAALVSLVTCFAVMPALQFVFCAFASLRRCYVEDEEPIEFMDVKRGKMVEQHCGILGLSSGDDFSS